MMPKAHSRHRVARGDATRSAQVAVDELQRGRMRRLVGRVAPGLEALSRYQVSWLPGDLAAGLSVAAIFPLVAYALFGSSRQLVIGPDAATCMMLVDVRRELADEHNYPTLTSAVDAYSASVRQDAGRQMQSP